MGIAGYAEGVAEKAEAAGVFEADPEQALRDVMAGGAEADGEAQQGEEGGVIDHEDGADERQGEGVEVVQPIVEECGGKEAVPCAEKHAVADGGAAYNGKKRDVRDKGDESEPPREEGVGECDGK